MTLMANVDSNFEDSNILKSGVKVKTCIHKFIALLQSIWI